MTRTELEAMTKDELVAYADDRDIEVHHHWVKDEIVSEILKAEKKAAKQGAKQGTKHETTHGTKHETKIAEDTPPDPTTEVSPELAALQKKANEPPDPKTQFASSFKEEE